MVRAQRWDMAGTSRIEGDHTSVSMMMFAWIWTGLIAYSALQAALN